MSKKIMAIVAAVAVSSSLLLAGPAAVAGESISGKGSSFASNALGYCLAHYRNAAGDTVTYTSTGSGTGRSELAAGNVDWAASDGSYKVSDNQPSDYAMVPLLGGPIVFAYNKSSKIPADLKLDATVLGKIFKGVVKKWNDPLIKKLNKGKVLPAKTIKLVYRGGNTSGTNENLTTYFAATTTGWVAKKKDLNEGAGGTAGQTAALAPGATPEALSTLIADDIQTTKYSLGYFDLSDAVGAKFSLVALKNKHGEFVKPTAAAGAKFLAAQVVPATGNKLTDGVATLGFGTTSVKNAYQLTVLTYGIGYKGKGTAKATASKNWFKYVLNTCMPANASRLGYVALTGQLKTAALAQANSIG